MQALGGLWISASSGRGRLRHPGCLGMDEVVDPATTEKL